MGLRSKKGKRQYEDNKKKPPVKRFGRFTADGVCLQEVAINNRILRIPVSRPAGSTKRGSKYKSSNSSRLKANGLGASSRFIANKALTKRKPKYTARYLSFKALEQEVFESNSVQRIHKKKPTQGLKPIEMAFVTAPDEINSEQKSVQYQLMFKKASPLVQCTLAIDFAKLSESLRTMKLPSPTWKIKMWVRNEQTTTISITNNQELERSVTFKAKSKFFTIRVENVPVILLGCPETVSTIKDVQVLVNIINTIPLTDVMLLKI